MKKISSQLKSLIISFTTASFLILITLSVSGKNYYFSTSGGDDTRTSAQAQSPATPWKTITKLNSSFISMLPGDSVLFKRGETFYGSIKIAKSGTAALPIIIGSYGTGVNPIITGFTAISSWTDEGNGIFSKVVTCESSPNMVTVNGVQYAMGRYPNSGTWLTYESFTGTSSITDNQLTGTPNWTGAEVVIRKNPYILDRNTISNHSGTTISYTTLGSTATPVNDYGYFIQNDLKTLDQFGEWYYNGSKFYMYFGTNNPNNYTVNVASIDKLLYNSVYDYITVTKLAFTGANINGISFENAADFGVIKNCEVYFSGQDGIFIDSKYGIIDNTSINHVNKAGIETSSSFNKITNNVINNCGIIPGSAFAGSSSVGLFAAGADNLFQYNSIDSVGYDGIVLAAANRSVVKNNLITYFCLNLNDGGGIYTTGTTTTGRVIDGNIILYGIGNLGRATGNILIDGIYLDEPTSDISVINNTCAFMAYSGIKLHNNNNIRVRANTLFANTICDLRIQESNTTTPLRSNSFYSNIIFAKNSTELTLKHISVTDDITLLGTLDSNYYARPIDDNLTIQTGTPTAGTVNRTVATWKTFSLQDVHANKSPKSITSVNDLRFEFNATTSPKIISLPGTYIDVKGTVYTNSITLQPYTSAVLILTAASSNQAPIILNQSFQINENSANGNTVGTIIASDPDAGQIKTYSIISGNTSSAFSINSSTGIITVANTAALNYEITPTFPLVVKVQDNGSPSLSSQATITISILNVNEPPVISSQTFSANANAANSTIIGSVLATDPDAGQTLTYSIISGNTNNAFSINSTTGVLSVATSSALNYATTPTFTLVVKVQDNGTGTLSSQGTITVNLVSVGPCSATGNISYQIWNNITGSAVSNLTSNINYPDSPTSSSLITSMKGTTNLADNFGARIAGYICAPATGSYTFWISSDENGELWLSTNNQPTNKQLIAYNLGTTFPSEWTKYTTQKSATINLVQGQSYYIEALMKENTGNDNLAVGWAKPGQVTTGPSEIIPGTFLSPLVTNINQTPIIGNQTFSINENSSNGTPTGTVLATDPNAGQTLTYSILSGNTNGAFAINSLTGVLTVANSVALDYETTPSFVLAIKVVDNGTGNLSSQANITVSLIDVNEVPVISNQIFSIAENPINGTITGTVVASDPDAGQSLTYSILSGNTNLAFSINSSTGVLTVSNSTALNFEVFPSFALVVKVQDNGTGNLSSQAIITVTLININETPVINNQSFSIAENSVSGTIVGTVIASDPDAGQTLTYSILSGNTSVAFTINSATGVLSVSNSSALNFEAITTYTLIVNVQDNGTGNLSSQASITLNILNLNEPPVVNNQIFSIDANAANGTLVDTVFATDPDAGQTLAYSILSGNTNSAFSINATTGILTVATSSALNFTTTPIFSLVVKVQDNGSGTLSSQATITVNLIGPCTANGNISYQVWNNITGSAVINLTSNVNFPNSPTTTTLITSMKGTTNLADNFGARIVGYICAPTTGSYIFWIASDENGELWLSTNDQAANKQLIAYNSSATYPSQWNKYPTQKSVAINLIKGKSYYIEALMKENLYSDNFAVAWSKPGQAVTGPSEIIPGSVLSPIVIKSKEVTLNPITDGLEIKMSVYPNPLGSEELNIKLENLSSQATLNIYSVSGVLYYKDIINGTSMLQVDGDIFKSGVYFVKVFNDHFIKTAKLIIK